MLFFCTYDVKNLRKRNKYIGFYTYEVKNRRKHYKYVVLLYIRKHKSKKTQQTIKNKCFWYCSVYKYRPLGSMADFIFEGRTVLSSSKVMGNMSHNIQYWGTWAFFFVHKHIFDTRHILASSMCHHRILPNTHYICIF